LEHDTYLIGTLRSNRIGSAKVLDKDLGRGEVYGLESQDGINTFTTMWPTGGPRFIVARICIEKHFLLIFS